MAVDALRLAQSLAGWQTGVWSKWTERQPLGECWTRVHLRKQQATQRFSCATALGCNRKCHPKTTRMHLDGSPTMASSRWQAILVGYKIKLDEAGKSRRAASSLRTVVVVVVVMLMAPNSKLKSKGRCAVNACNIACAAVARFILVCALP